MEIDLLDYPEPQGETKYFVGSLSFNTDNQGLASYFARQGQVISSTVIMDKMTGKSKGFAFVTMREPITDLSRVDNTELDGRTIFVDQARPLEKREGIGRPKGRFDRDNWDLRGVVEKIEIGFTLIDDQFKIVELFEDKNDGYVDKNNNNLGLLHIFNSYSQQLIEEKQELEYLMNKTGVKESELHKFFEHHPEYLLDENYKNAHSKIILQKGSTNSNIPDFVLEPHDKNSLCDLLEIKLPSTKIYTKTRHRENYSASVFKALAQLREYASYFDDSANRAKIVDKYGLTIYKPNLILVIGRNKAIDPFLLKRVGADIPGLKLITYDTILDRAKRRKF